MEDSSWPGECNPQQKPSAVQNSGLRHFELSSIHGYFLRAKGQRWRLEHPVCWLVTSP